MPVILARDDDARWLSEAPRDGLFADDLFANDLLGAGDQGRRGGVDRCDDLLRLAALGRTADRKLEPLRVREELRILHRMIEGRPDDREPIGRHLPRTQ